MEHVSNQPDDSHEAEATLQSTIVLVVSLLMDEAGLQQVQAMLHEVRPCLSALLPAELKHQHVQQIDWQACMLGQRFCTHGQNCSPAFVTRHSQGWQDR